MTTVEGGQARRGRGLRFAMAAALAFAVLGCGTTQSSTSPQSPGASSSAAAAPSSSAAAATEVLVLGTDISDARTLDPHRTFDFSPGLSLNAVYQNLVTVRAPNYSELIPELATSWELVDDGGAWLFHLKDGVKFASGNPFTAEDVKFSFERLKNLQDIPSTYASNLASVEVVDPLTAKLVMVDKGQPLLSLLTTTVTWGILDSKVAIEKGGISDVTAKDADKIGTFLDGASIGTGRYQLQSWERNQQIVLTPNPNFVGDPAPFERIIIRHFADTSAELLAFQNGDIHLAHNLNADQLKSLDGTAGTSILAEPSLDMMYWTLGQTHAESGALAKLAARRAVASAVDYDGMIQGLLGGFAVRPANFLPIGMSNAGSTQEFADQHGFKEDLDAARGFLAEAGEPDGFEFDLSYGTSTFAGVPFEAIAQKIKSDLARVGIVANLKPAEFTTYITAFRAGEIVSGLAPWATDGPEPYLMAEAAVNRIATRGNWTPTQALKDTVLKAAAETDPAKQKALYEEFQLALIDQVAYIVPFQPTYRVAVNDTITNVNLTAAGGFLHLQEIEPAP